MINAKKIQQLNKAVALLWLALIIFNAGLVPLIKASELPPPEATSSAKPVKIENKNEAQVENEFKAESKTGGEDVSGNAGSVEIKNDDAEAIVDLVNETNTTTTEVERVESTDDPDIVVESTSSAEVKNDLDAEASAGDSEVAGNAGDVNIEEGDAVAAAFLDNHVNTTETEFLEATAAADPATPLDIEVLNDNDAEVQNEVTLEATAGADLVQGNAGDTTVKSGNAIAEANLLNFVNTDLTGSTFVSEINDIIGNLTNDINLAENFFNIFTQLNSDTSTTDLVLDNLGNLTVRNINEGALVNEVNLNALAGNAQILANAGDVNAQNGQASALANLINFLNTTLTGSNWFFNITNIFGDFIGDIILPGEAVGAPEGAPTFAPESFEVVNNNEAEVVNNLEATASAGRSVVRQNAGGVEIQNEGALADTNLVEYTNTNRVGESWVLTIVNKVGEWVGGIINEPENNLSVSEGKNSLVYDYSIDDACFGEDNTITSIPTNIAVENTNRAELINNVKVEASVAEYEINGNAGDATIKSGPAAALANVINFVNTNFVGGNWLFGLVNIFGDWRGDLIFAAPDLTVSKTDGRETANPDDELTYTITYQNQGQLRARNVSVSDTLPAEVNYVSDTSGVAPSVSGRTYTWLIGDVAAGESGSFTLTVKVDSNLPLGSHRLRNEVLVKTCTKESNLDNNGGTDLTIVEVYPDLEVAKDDGKSSAKPGEELTYTIRYKNVGNYPADNVKLNDQLPDRVQLLSEDSSWDLKTLDPGEEGAAKVKVRIDPEMPAGETVLTNNVSISTSTEEPNQENNSASDETSVYAAPDLAVSKDDGKGSAKPGEELTYTIEYENRGDAAAEDVVVVDELPDHLSFVSASEGGEQAADGNIVWRLGRVGAHSLDNVLKLKVRIDETMPSGVTTIENKVKISTTTIEDNTSNNEDTDTTEVEAHPVLEIRKENDAQGVVSIGGNINFRITISNVGGSKAFEVVLNDVLRDSHGNEVLPQSWEIGEIDVGEDVIVEYTLAVTDEVSEGSYANTAKAEGKDDRGNTVSSNEAQSTIEVKGGVVLTAATPEEGRGEVLGLAAPVTGGDDWMLVLAAVCLFWAGILLRRSGYVEYALLEAEFKG